MEVIARRILYQLTGNRLRVNCGILWVTAWTIIKMANDNPGLCSRIFHPIAKEFQKEKFGLSHQPPDDFLKSQWQTSQKSYLWLFYRWGLAICFSVGVLGSLVEQMADGLWFIYLTNWGFLLCMYVSLFGAILVTIYHFKPERFSNESKVLKFYWASHWSTLVLATVITFIYWLFIFPNDNASASELYNLWAHGFNTILMILDHMLVAFPTRLLHFIYPMTIGIIFAIFTVIYHFAGGVDVNGKPYIYAILDWSKPGMAAAMVVGCMVLVLLFGFILFCLYKLRSRIYRNCMNSKLTISA